MVGIIACQKRMPAHVRAAIQPWLGEAEAVELTGGGQALLRPRLLEWIWESSTAGW